MLIVTCLVGCGYLFFVHLFALKLDDDDSLLLTQKPGTHLATPRTVDTQGGSIQSSPFIEMKTHTGNIDLFFDMITMATI